MGLKQRQGLPCPNCRTEKVWRSRLRRFEWLLLPLPVRPFRCAECDARFWRPRWLARLIDRLHYYLLRG
jgi:hypothetical protein